MIFKHVAVAESGIKPSRLQKRQNGNPNSCGLVPCFISLIWGAGIRSQWRFEHASKWRRELMVGVWTSRRGQFGASLDMKSAPERLQRRRIVQTYLRRKQALSGILILIVILHTCVIFVFLFEFSVEGSSCSHRSCKGGAANRG